MNTNTNACCYKNCHNNRKYSPDLSFFAFPKDDRVSTWIINSGNDDLNLLDEMQLNLRVLCEHHFKPEYILSTSNNKRKLLVRHAVPIVSHEQSSFSSPSTEEKNSTPSPHVKQPVTKFYGRYLTEKDDNHQELPAEQEVCYLSPPGTSKRTPPKPAKRKLTFSPKKHNKLAVIYDTPQFKNQKRILARRRTEIHRLKKKVKEGKKIQKQYLENLLQNKSADQKTFVKMQIFHNRKTKWSVEQKKMALSFFYKSPALYKHMRQNSGFVLPSPRTISYWLKIFQLNTGVQTKFFQNFLVKVQTMEPSEKECVLIFDEIKLKSFLEYNVTQDVIEGFEDLGENRRKPRIANTGLVFMIRGLFSRWKQPISYYVTCGPIKGHELKILITENLEKCFNVGLSVRAIIADQGPNNRRAFTHLRTSEKNSFIVIRNKKVYILFDPPHLIKSIRNNLLKTDIFINGNLRVSWNDIVTVYNIDKKCVNVRALPNITERHIRPQNFDKMSVKLATQIFSRKMVTALKLASQNNLLTSSSALNTIYFVELVNNVFDCLNSKVLFHANPYQSALCMKNELVKKTLENAVDFFNEIKLYDKNDQERKNVYCFKGISDTIRAILDLYTDILLENYTFILTSRLQQDPIENLFSVIRSRGGYNNNPTTKGFRQALQQNMFVRILDPIVAGNCEVDDDEQLDLLQNSDTTIASTRTRDEFLENMSEDEIYISDNDDSDGDEYDDKPQNLITFEENSAAYYTGYLIYKCLTKYKCNMCKEVFCKSDDEQLCNKTEILTLLRDYGDPSEIEFLCRPKKEIVNIVIFILKIIVHFFNFNKHMPNLKKKN